MSIQNINSTTVGRVATTSRSRLWAARATVVAAVAIAGGATCTAARTSVATEAPTPVRLALMAVAKDASSQGYCGSGLKLMKVSETQKMIAPPTSAKDVEDADHNGDSYICVKMPRGGGRPTHFEDNWYTKSNSGGSGGCDKGGMTGGGPMKNGCGTNMGPRDAGGSAETSDGEPSSKSPSKPDSESKRDSMPDST